MPSAKCPECGSTRIRRDEKYGEVVCENCSLVTRDKVISRNQPRSDSEAEVSGEDHPYYEKRTGPYSIESRKRRQHKRESQRNKNLFYALDKLEGLCNYFSLPKNVEDRGEEIYSDAFYKNLTRGRSRESLVAAAVYIACREYGIPRTLDEIAEASRLEKKVIDRAYHFVARELETRMPPRNPIQYIPRFASSLNLPEKVSRTAIDIIKEAIDMGIGNAYEPTGLAASAIYIAAYVTGERRTQSEVAKVAGISEVTIRNRYKELVEELGIAISEYAEEPEEGSDRVVTNTKEQRDRARGEWTRIDGFMETLRKKISER